MVESSTDAVSSSEEERRTCSVCGDTKEVLRHYQVDCCYGCKSFFRRSVNENKKYYCAGSGNCHIDKATRNRCRSCRFQKCLNVGMSEANIRDNRINKPCTSSSSGASGTEVPLQLPPLSPSSDEASRVPEPSLSPAARTLIDFLTSMTNACMSAFDPLYAHLNLEEWKELDKHFGRSVSLAEGLRDPSLVAPRTKLDFSCSRPVESHDMAFCWYRSFVVIADWANGLPQFRMLPSEDQELLFRMNFIKVCIVYFVYKILIQGKGCDLDKMPIGNGAYMQSEDTLTCTKSKKTTCAYKVHLFRPFAEMDIDLTEILLCKALVLFQCCEALSESGKAVATKFVCQICDTLFEYQTFRFPDQSDKQRNRRYSRLLMTMSKISQIWSFESDTQLMLATFDHMNIDGIPKELLFYKYDVKNSVQGKS